MVFYIILTSNDIIDLASQVNGQLDHYRPIGGVAVRVGSAGGQEYYQAMQFDH